MSKNASDIKVTVLGGGVIGLTQALIMQLHGYTVHVISKDRFNKHYSKKLIERPPELASIHAAASVIPHSVDHPSEKEILAVSQKFFHRLAFSAGFGVRIQRHYEVHERKISPPEYARTVKDFTLLPDNGSGWVNDHNIPRRKDAEGVWGWFFNAFFAEVPTYMDALFSVYEAAGGTIAYKEIKSKKEIEKLDADIIINCLGRWAVEFFPKDKSNCIIARGHMIKVGIHEVPHDHRDHYFSYNYEPSKDVYWRKQNKKKTKADVYFYPRSDGWLLGGSRQEGFPNLSEPWGKNDEQTDPKIKMVKLKNWEVGVPSPIWNLNRDLVYDITGIDVQDPKYPSFSYVGYRFVRKPIRIEESNDLEWNVKEKLLFHNYGHGGGGYTLSWGSAYEILKLIEDKNSVKVEIGKKGEMAKGYATSMVKVLTDLVVEEYINRRKNDFTPYID